MEDDWIEHILHFVPEALKERFSEDLEKLCDETRDRYLLSVKKAIGKPILLFFLKLLSLTVWRVGNCGDRCNCSDFFDDFCHQEVLSAVLGPT